MTNISQYIYHYQNMNSLQFTEKLQTLCGTVDE